MRNAGLLLTLGLLGGCVTDGNFADGGLTSSGVRWGGPYGNGPYSRSSPVFGNSPYANDQYDQSSSGGQTFRPQRDVVCDRGTEACYRGRQIDASETRNYFGRRAALQVDRVRDAAGTNRIYRVDDEVVCNQRREVCLKNGRPDRSETRDFFGKKAGRKVQ